MTNEIKGWHVFAGFSAAFGVIVAVNLTLAYNAVMTFPGLEVRNSYVASQTFDDDRAAQLALGWDVEATLTGHELALTILEDGQPISPDITEAIFGRATFVGQDETPNFVFDGTAMRATVSGGPGNWNLRIKADASDGTLFQQRIIVRVIE